MKTCKDICLGQFWEVCCSPTTEVVPDFNVMLCGNSPYRLAEHGRRVVPKAARAHYVLGADVVAVPCHTAFPSAASTHEVCCSARAHIRRGNTDRNTVFPSGGRTTDRQVSWSRQRTEPR